LTSIGFDEQNLYDPLGLEIRHSFDCIGLKLGDDLLAGLDRQKGVVGVAEYKRFRSTPDDSFHVHHGPHFQAKLPQQDVLNEIPGQSPGPERQLTVTDRAKSDVTQPVHQQVAADEVVPPIVEKGGDVSIILLPATVLQRRR